MSGPGAITPPVTRETFLDALRAADRLVNACALGNDVDLLRTAWLVQREAWLALERFDRRAERENHTPPTRHYRQWPGGPCTCGSRC